MVHGLDTGFLVAAEVAEHADHFAARRTLARLVAAGDRIAIAPQVLAELIHVVTGSTAIYSIVERGGSAASRPAMVDGLFRACWQIRAYEDPARICVEFGRLDGDRSCASCARGTSPSMGVAKPEDQQR